MRSSPVSPGKVVLLFGATGNAGSGALRACLDDPRVSAVRAVTRSPLATSHAKLEALPCSDFVDLRALSARFEGVHTCLFCLGTSVRNVSGEAEYREIHVT